MVFFYHLLIPAFGLDKLPWKGGFRDFGSVGWEFWVVYPFTYGSAGVAVFFVVSGFCIHLSHSAKRDASWREFTIRRFFRIMPPYWIAVLVFFFLLPLDSSLIWSKAGYETLGAHLLAVHNLREWWLLGINPSFWTIAVEVQLYAIYPLLMWVVTRKGWAFALLCTAVLEFSLRALSSYLVITGAGQLPVFVSYSPFYFWFSWSLGAGLAEGYRRGILPDIPAWVTWAAIASAFASPLFIATDPFKFPLFAVATSLVILRCLRSPSKENDSLGIAAGTLAAVGTVSYSFYLYHQPMLLHAGEALKSFVPSLAKGGLLLLVVLVSLLPIVYLVSRISYLWFEKPSNAAGKRWATGA